MKKNADQHCRAIDYVVGDAVLLNTRYLRFKNRPKKLQQQFVGPFHIKKKINSLRIRPACILVSTCSISQFSVEALAGVKVELPSRHARSRLGSLIGASIPGGEDTQVEEGFRRPLSGKGSSGDMDGLSFGGNAVDQ